MKTQISAVIIAKNEAMNLSRTLPTLLGVVDEVVLIDTGSEDATVEVAQRLLRPVPHKVLATQWRGFGSTKNWGVEQASFDWILSLDADEPLSPDLQQELLELKMNGLDTSRIYSLDRQTNYCGQFIRFSGLRHDWHQRLYARSTARWSDDQVHEKLVIQGNLQTLKLRGRLYHYSIRNLEDHITRINRYTSLACEKLLKNQPNKKVGLVTVYSRGLIKFLRIYFFELGFLDGWRGFAIASISGFSGGLKYLKLVEAQNDAHPK